MKAALRPFESVMHASEVLRDVQNFGSPSGHAGREHITGVVSGDASEDPHDSGGPGRV